MPGYLSVRHGFWLSFVLLVAAPLSPVPSAGAYEVRIAQAQTASNTVTDRQRREQALRQQRAARERQRQAQLTANTARFERVDAGYSALARRIREGRRLRGSGGSAQAVPRADPALRDEVVALGGQYYAALLDYDLVTDGSASVDRVTQVETDVQVRRQAEARRRARTARDAIVAEIRKLDAIEARADARDGSRALRAVQRRLARQRLRTLGGSLTVDAYDAVAERRRLAASVGMNPASPFLDRHVAIDAADIAGPLLSQGERMICGYIAAQMAAARGCQTSPISLADLARAVPIEGAAGAETGVAAPQIESMLRENGVDARVANLGSRREGVRRIADHFSAGPGAGPVIISVAASRTMRALANASDSAVRSLYLPDELAHGVADASVLADARNRYRHWIVVDGVVHLDIQRGSATETVPHFMVRDPDGGKAFYYAVDDMGAIFDGDLVQVAP